MTTSTLAALACLLALAAGGTFAQTIYKCKGPDGRITYSSLACAGEGEAISKGGRKSVSAPPSSGAAQVPQAQAHEATVPSTRGTLPKECDNALPLKAVVTRLDSPATPDDVRPFLADERFRLMRCEYTRFTPEERRERDAAMNVIDSRDVATRRGAMMRIQALYDRYLTAADRAARSANRQR